METPSLNIKLVIANLAGGGAERAALLLAECMTELGHDAEIILFEDVVAYDVPAGVRVSCLRGAGGGGWFRSRARMRARALREHLRGRKVDLTIAFMLHAQRACKLAGAPHLWNRIGNALGGEISAEKTARRARRLLQKSRRVYDGANVVTISKGVADDLLALGIRPKAVRVVHNPADIAGVRRQARAFVPEEGEYIVHVGRFHEQKRHDLLVKAYRQSGIPQKLLLLGDDTLPTAEKTRALVGELGLRGRVIFKGFVRNPYPYIQHAKALVLCSDYEGFGLVQTEALALGVPVVSTDCVSGPAEILTGELAAFLSPPGDAGALAANIAKVIANPPEITAEHAERFDVKICARKYLALRETSAE